MQITVKATDTIRIEDNTPNGRAVTLLGYQWLMAWDEAKLATRDRIRQSEDEQEQRPEVIECLQAAFCVLVKLSAPCQRVFFDKNCTCPLCRYGRALDTLLHPAAHASPHTPQ